MNYKNNRLLNVLNGQPVDTTPVWIMRQAGRYLPSYRETRAKAGDFMTLCRTPELATEVTLQPVTQFSLDAAILFSDILTIPDAMGLGLYFTEEGPQFDSPLRTPASLRSARRLCVETDLAYVMNAVRMIRHELADKLPLIGFSGSPWTLATYMLEGRSSRDFYWSKQALYSDPEGLQILLSLLAENVGDYLLAQIQAGVDCVMIFDTWGGILTPAAYRQFSLHSMSDIVKRVKTAAPNTPIIIFSKGCAHHIPDIAALPCDAIGVDWTVDLADVRQRLPRKMALQGNLDPGVLYGSDAAIREEVERVLNSYGHGGGHIFNLGHGITPQVDPAKVALVVDTVHELSRPFHV